jgi:hypothetical protein
MKIFHKLLLLLLVLAFTGQGLVANALPCQMPMTGEAAAHTADMAAVDHTGHHMPMGAGEVAEGASDVSCCGAGLCAMSHCQLSSALPPDHLASSPQYAVLFPRINGSVAPVHPNDSLYRPPISR